MGWAGPRCILPPPVGTLTLVAQAVSKISLLHVWHGKMVDRTSRAFPELVCIFGALNPKPPLLRRPPCLQREPGASS